MRAMRNGERQHCVQGETHSIQAVTAQVAAIDQRILRLGQRMEVPAIEFAHLLPEHARIHAQVRRQAGPVDVSLLDADLTILERHENLRGRVRVEVGLERELELARDHLQRLALRKLELDIAGSADLRIHRRRVALPAHELGRLLLRRVGNRFGRLSRCLGCRCAQRGEVITCSVGGRDTGDTPGGHDALEALVELDHRRRKGIGARITGWRLGDDNGGAARTAARLE